MASRTSGSPGRLGVAVNTVSKWRKRLSKKAFQGWGIASGRVGRAGSPSAVVVEVKAIACELPATRAVPLSRWSLAELREEVITTGLVRDVSVSTLWRWLDQAARVASQLRWKRRTGVGSR
jgi:hypothetical protein